MLDKAKLLEWLMRCEKVTFYGDGARAFALVVDEIEEGKFDAPHTEEVRRLNQKVQTLQDINETLTGQIVNEVELHAKSCVAHQVEVRQLREERDEYKKLLHEKHAELSKVTTQFGKEIERCSTLKKERDKLVKALEQMDDRKKQMMPRSQMARIAKNALDEIKGAANK